MSFSYDWFESGLSNGPGSWWSLSRKTISTMRTIKAAGPTRPATIEPGDATTLRFRSKSMDVVVTDPPYDDMIDYSDSSDLFYVWAKRAVETADPTLAVTAHPDGVQQKDSEIIVKRGGTPTGDHRTQQHYDRMIAEAFRQARRVIADDGLVTIVFGHGDFEVWHRLLAAISTAELVMTSSWPAKTEAGGAAAGAANIVTTLTMSCRPALPNRPDGRAAAVEARVRDEIRKRVGDWEQAALAPGDMLMASAGPAMEIVGEYTRILNNRAEPVEIDHYLVVARRAVQDALAVEIDHHPLDAFDPRTRFALWWAQVHGREFAAKSDLRWEALAADMPLDEVKDLVPAGKNGCRLVESKRFKRTITENSPVIDVTLTLALALEDGLAAVGEVLVASGRDAEDVYLWATMRFLADRLPASDPDAAAWTRVLRNRSGVGSAAKAAANARSSTTKALAAESAQTRLL